MEFEKIFGGLIAIAGGLYAIVGRKSLAFIALRKNIFKPNYDEKRLKYLETAYLLFGVIFVLCGIIILINR